MVNIVFNHLLILFTTLQLLSVYGSNTSKLISFSTYLIHRDSIESPLYDSSINKTNLLERAIRRSNSRLSHLKSISKFSNNDTKDINAIESTIGVSMNNEYLIEISIGTPPIKQLAIFDTGSELVWTQCLPCVNCFEQTQPKFNSERSRSYQELICGGKECDDLGDYKTCISNRSKCEYTIDYEDNSYSSGDLALETFKLGDTFFPHMVYGCSKNNIGVFYKTIAGIVGFGDGPYSLISQLRPMIGGKFSYCLVHHSQQNARSKISFGASAILSGQSTSLSNYYIILEGISVQNIAFSSHDYMGFPFRGPALLDTGTYLTYLPTDLYQQFENAIRSMIRVVPIQSGNFQICYTFYPTFPTIIFHFSGGAQLVLTMKNTIIQNNNLWCLTILPTDNDEDDDTLIGSLSQMDYMIGYDLENELVSFMATNCSNH